MLNWLGIVWATGDIICSLPGIQIQGQLAATIGQPETANLVLNLDADTAPEWVQATAEGYGALIAWTGDPAAPVIVWGGVVQQRIRSPFSPQVQLSATTPDGWLASVPVGNLSGTYNQDTLLANLMGFATGTHMPPWVLIHSSNASTQQQAVSYQASQEQNVLAALQSASAYNGGPQWMTGWQWNLTAGKIKPTFTYGQRIGQVADPVLGPQVTFTVADMQGASTLSEDYSPGRGANTVTATLTPTAGGLITATATAPDLRGRPLTWFSYSPSSGAAAPAGSDLPTVAGVYAAAAVNAISDGSPTQNIVVSNTLPGKQFGDDWNLGDDVGWEFTGIAFPDAPSGVAQCIGYKADLTTVTPILKGAVIPT